MKNIKRVAHVLTKMDVGGAETLLMNIYRNIDRSKYQFDFIVHAEEDGYYDKEIKNLGGRVIKIDAPEKVGVKKYGEQLIETLKKYGEYQAVHAHAHFFNGYILMMAKKAGVKKRVSHSHNSSDGAKQTLKRNIYRIAMRTLILWNATNLLSCSDKASKELYGISSKRAKFIPNSVKFDLFKSTKLDLRKELGVESDSRIIGHVGRFNDVKNHKFLIDTFEKLSNELEKTYLVLVGDGPLKKEMQELVREKGISNRVFFLGLRGDVPDIIQNFDLFMFPSKFEGLPVTLVEIQAAKIRAIIANNITRDLLFTDGLITYLPIDNIDLWVREGIKLLNCTDKFDKEVIKFKNTDFDIDSTIEKLVKIYG